jgi:hypothetical protein
MAFPIAFRFFADSLTFWFRGLAVGYTVRLFANRDALRAVEHFAAFIRAFYLADWLFTFDVTYCVFWFSAGCMTFRRLTYGITDCRAVRVIAFPCALRMALGFGR